MDKLEYLNQISKSNRPVKQVKESKINFGLIFKILLGGLVLVAILIGLGIMINSEATRATDLSRQLYVRMTGINKTITDYNKQLKSSQLRSISYSLSGTLTGTSTQLATYLNKVYEGDSSALIPSNQTLTTESNIMTSVNGALAKAKLNGTLDRTYTAQMQYMVSLLMSLTTELLARDKDPELVAILTPFYSNLTVIEQSFQNYSSPSD